MQVAGPPARAQLALRRLIELASEKCGLTPTGHKFVLYSPTEADKLDGAARRAVHDMESDIEGWTPQAALTAGKRCAAQSDGVVAAGVPIGTAAFVRREALAKIESHETAHVRLRLMPDVQAAYLMLRFCLGVRVIFLLRALGGAMIGGDDAPGAKHNSFLRESLDELLTDPTKPPSRRLELAEAGHPMRVYAQARLRAKDGGLGLTCAYLVHAAAHVSGVVSCLAFISTHRSILHAPTDLLSAACDWTVLLGLCSPDRFAHQG